MTVEVEAVASHWELLQPWLDALNAVRFERYPTAAAVNAFYWQSLAADANVELSDDTQYTGITGDGREIFYTAEQEEEGLKIRGVWGWCDQTPLTAEPRGVPIIHYWLNTDPEQGVVPDYETALEFFSHELSHGVLEPLLNAHKGDPDSELLADMVAAIAVMASRLASEAREKPAPDLSVTLPSQMDTCWPTLSAIDHLCQFVERQLGEGNYDGDRYERLQTALAAVRFAVPPPDGYTNLKPIAQSALPHSS